MNHFYMAFHFTYPVKIRLRYSLSSGFKSVTFPTRARMKHVSQREGVTDAKAAKQFWRAKATRHMRKPCETQSLGSAIVSAVLINYLSTILLTVNFYYNCTAISTVIGSITVDTLQQLKLKSTVQNNQQLNKTHGAESVDTDNY